MYQNKSYKCTKINPIKCTKTKPIKCIKISPIKCIKINVIKCTKICTKHISRHLKKCDKSANNFYK